MSGAKIRAFDPSGRSALLLGKAKDNNASCAIGPFIRLFDAHFGMADVHRCELGLLVDGPEGFTHVVGDVVRIDTPTLGALVNRMNHSHKTPPWSFGIAALMRNLAGRSLL